MHEGYELLTERPEMWARMLMQVLEDNSIPCVAFPVHGAGLVARTGLPERLKIFVPAEKLSQAEELMHELFAAE